MQLGFAKAHHKITSKKRGRGPALEELPKIWRFPFNTYSFYTKAEASSFKFGTQLGFAKAHHKITPRGKIVHGPGPEVLPLILEFLSNISTTV